MNNSKLAFWMKKKNYISLRLFAVWGCWFRLPCQSLVFCPCWHLSFQRHVLRSPCCSNCVSSLSFIYLINPLSSYRFVLFLSLAVTVCTLAGRLDGFQYMFAYKNIWDPSWSLNGLFYVLTRSLSSDSWAVSFSAASLCFWLGVSACGRLST